MRSTTPVLSGSVGSPGETRAADQRPSIHLTQIDTISKIFSQRRQSIFSIQDDHRYQASRDAVPAESLGRAP